MHKIKIILLCSLLLCCLYPVHSLEKTVIQEKDSAKTDQDLRDRVIRLEDKMDAAKEWNTDNRKWVESEQARASQWMTWEQIILAIITLLVAVLGFLGYFIIRRYAKRAKRDADKATELLEEIKKTVALAKDHKTEIEHDAEEVRKILTTMPPEGKLTKEQENSLNEIIAKLKDELKSSGLDALKNLYYANAIKAYDEGKFEEALRLFNNYIDLFGGDSNAFFRRGYINDYSLGEKDEALNDYNKSIQLDSNSPGSYINRGIIYMSKGEYKEAFDDFNKAINIDPKASNAYNNRGLLYENEGDITNALLNYNEAINHNPQIDAKVYNNRARIYELMGKTIEAAADRAKAKELDPDIEEKAKNS